MVVCVVKANNKEEVVKKVSNMPYNELVKYLVEYGSLSIGDVVIEDEYN